MTEVKKDLSKITLRIGGKDKVFKKDFVSGDMMLTALKFKAKFERLARNAEKDLKKENPNLKGAELQSELMNVMYIDNNYLEESAELISLSFGSQFTPEEFISGVSAGKLLNTSVEYVEAALNGVAEDVSEETENLQEKQ